VKDNSNALIAASKAIAEVKELSLRGNHIIEAVEKVESTLDEASSNVRTHFQEHEKALASAISDLRGSIDTHKANLDRISSELRAAHGEFLNARSEITAAQRQLDETRSSMQTRMNELNSRLKSTLSLSVLIGVMAATILILDFLK